MFVRDIQEDIGVMFLSFYWFLFLKLFDLWYARFFSIQSKVSFFLYISWLRFCWIPSFCIYLQCIMFIPQVRLHQYIEVRESCSP